jgi:hypothetical protein
MNAQTHTDRALGLIILTKVRQHGLFSEPDVGSWLFSKGIDIPAVRLSRITGNLVAAGSISQSGSPRNGRRYYSAN